MCPWPRIQAALTDEYALNVTYRYDRGEPRASVKKAAALHAQGQPAGDCIDCLQCVHVCPTGVDIRGGPNLGCIQCGLCIDACDAVMAKIGRPPRLIAYDTDINIKRRQRGREADLPHRAHPHGALCRHHRGGRRADDLYAGDPQQRRASASSTIAIRCSCGCPTARCATPIRCASSTRRSNTEVSRCQVAGLRRRRHRRRSAVDGRFGRQSAHRGRARSDAAKCAFW